jgi:hypothetical protein
MSRWVNGYAVVTLCCVAVALVLAPSGHAGYAIVVWGLASIGFAVIALTALLMHRSH